MERATPTKGEKEIAKVRKFFGAGDEGEIEGGETPPPYAKGSGKAVGRRRRTRRTRHSRRRTERGPRRYHRIVGRSDLRQGQFFPCIPGVRTMGRRNVYRKWTAGFAARSPGQLRMGEMDAVPRHQLPPAPALL